MSNVEISAADRPGFLKLPKTFWVVLTGFVGMLAFSLFKWVSIEINPIMYGRMTVSFSFSNLFKDFSHTGLYYLFDESMTKYNAFRIIAFAVMGILLISFAILIYAMVAHRKKAIVKLAMIGFSIGSFAALLFSAVMMIFTKAVLASGLTLLPIAVFVIPLATMPFLLDPTQVESKRLSRFLHQKAFFYMIIPVMVYVFIFSYLPLSGWQMAFQNFKPGASEQEWVGLQQFKFLFTGGDFWRIMANTLGMSVIRLVLDFCTAIFLALMINELRQRHFKRVVQTISYLPHFLSWVIAASIITQFLSSSGMINQLMVWLGVYDEPRIILAEPDSFWWVVGWSNVWKSVGWNTIIYLAAITSIDPELYESAELDGAGRFAKMWFITLPGIKSTILVLLIMSIGWILNAGYEVQYLLGNDLTWSRAETIDVFVIRYGISLRNYSLATALGMFKTVVSIILIAGANFLSRNLAKESLV